MAVLRTCKACVRKQSICCETIADESKLSNPVDQTWLLIQYFIAVSQVPARGVPGGQSSRSAYDSCTHCGLPVYLAERLLVGSKRALYHRTCFRCARCSAQLTLANCYETENQKFCCETCPDEELDKSDTSSQGTDRVDFSDSKSESIHSTEAVHNPVHHRTSLSDDEKNIETEPAVSSRENSDEYSALFESTMEKFQGRKPPSQLTAGKAPLAITQQLPNDLFSNSSQKTLQATAVHSNEDEDLNAKLTLSNDNEPVDQCGELSLCQSTKDGTKPPNEALAKSEEISSGVKQHCSETDDQMSFQDEKVNVNSVGNVSKFSDNQSLDDVSTELSEVNNCTKDSKISSADSSALSIVKMRKMMFEGENTNSPERNAISFRKSCVTPSKVNAGVVDTSEIQKSQRAQEDKSSVPLDVHHTNGKMFASEDVAGKILRKEEDVICNETENSKHLGNSGENTPGSKDAEGLEENGGKEKQKTYTNNESRGNFQKDVSKKEKLESEALDSSVSSKPQVSPRKVFLAPKEPQTFSGQNEKDAYPVELNPFGDEEGPEEEKPTVVNLSTESKKGSTNPFGSSDEDEPVTLRTKSPSQKPPRPPPPVAVLQESPDKKDERAPSGVRPATVAIMSLGSPFPAQRRVIPAAANLNPFWSDGEEPEEEDGSTPVPLPRTLRVTPEPSPRPRTSVGTSSRMTSSSGKLGSSSSLSSMVSNTGSNRRSKKPAPAPPSHSYNTSLPPSPSPSIRSPHKRKSRPAPQPPTISSSIVSSDEVAEKTASLDGRKLLKDEANRSKQAVAKEEPALPRDKSTFGQWKRKKGPAPPRPLPQRRQVRAMPLKELKRELDDIEVQQLGLERQGVKLEQTIRLKLDEAPQLNELSMTPDVEDLVIQLFELVNEKNELFRKQAELMYLRRQQRLEEEHAELEYQIRLLMEQPERNKTDIIKAREEELIQRLVEVVERRNEIIECLEMDRIREAEEDQSIHSRLGLFAAKNTRDSKEPSPIKIKKDKKKKKEKDSKKKKDSKVDADKDIDEVEAAATAAAKEKKGKKRWF